MIDKVPPRMAVLRSALFTYSFALMFFLVFLYDTRNGIIAIAGLTYLSYFLFSLSGGKDGFIKKLELAFFASVAVLATIVAVQYDDPVVSDYTNRNERLFLYPLMAIMAMAANYFLARHYKFEATKPARWVIPALALGGLVFVAYRHYANDLSPLIRGEFPVQAYFTKNPNSGDDFFAGAFGLMSAWFFAGRLWRSKWQILGYVLLGVIFIYFFFANDSLGGHLGALCGIIVACLINLPKRSRNAVFLGLAVLGVVAALNAQPILKAVSPYSVDANDMANLLDPEFDSSTDKRASEPLGAVFTRAALLKVGFELVKERPFAGYGVYDQQRFIKEGFIPDTAFFSHAPHVHNFFLDAAIRHGVLMPTLYIVLGLILLVLLIKALDTNRDDLGTRLALSALIALLVYQFVQNQFDVTLMSGDKFQMHIIYYSTIGAVLGFASLRYRGVISDRDLRDPMIPIN